MSNAVSLADQRTALFDAIRAVPDVPNVEKYLRKDPIPPVIVIDDPRIDFPDNSYVGLVEWTINMYAVRKAQPSVSEDFDTALPALLMALSHGVKIGYRLLRVDNRIMTVEGYPLPGYSIIGAAALPNC